MPANDGFITALRIHKRWADLYSILSIVLVVGLMVAVALLTDIAEADAPIRTDMMIVMAATVIVVCIWQAAGMVAARIRELILEQRGDSVDPMIHGS
jgi:hypothetical protein